MRAFWAGLLVSALFTGIVYYSYTLAPDWMWMYFVKASDVPAWFTPYALILYLFAYALGFFLHIELRKLGSLWPVLMILIAAAAAVGVTLPLKDRYMSVGTLEQFQAGLALPLNQSAVGKLPGILTGALLPIGIGLLVWSRRQKLSKSSL